MNATQGSLPVMWKTSMTGLKTTTAIRAKKQTHPRKENLSVVATTQNNEKESDKEKSVIDYFPKRFKTGELVFDCPLPEKADKGQIS
jgi:CheY-like chemotaxis protein